MPIVIVDKVAIHKREKLKTVISSQSILKTYYTWKQTVGTRRFSVKV